MTHAHPRPSAPVAASVPGAAPHVLVVEDDPALRVLIREILELDGYQVTTAADGLEALATLPAGRPDLVLLDLGLPHMNGWELQPLLRHGAPGVPLVFMSAGFRVVSEARIYQAEGYLAKPFGPTELLEVIGRLAPWPASWPTPYADG